MQYALSCRNAGYYVGVFNNNKYMVEDAKYSLRARWVQQGSLLCPWDCHGGGKCTDILGQPTCVCYDGACISQALTSFM